MKMAYQKLFKLSLILETMLRKTLVITWQQTSSSISTAVTFVKILNSLVSCAFGNNQSQKSQKYNFHGFETKVQKWLCWLAFDIQIPPLSTNNRKQSLPSSSSGIQTFLQRRIPSTIPLHPVFAFCIRKTALCGTRIFTQHPPKEKKFAFSSNIQQLSIRALQSQLAPPPFHKYC